MSIKYLWNTIKCVVYLVGALEHGFYDFPETVGNGMSSSQLTKSIIFQRGRAQPPTSNWGELTLTNIN